MSVPKPQAGDRVFLCVHFAGLDPLPSGMHYYGFNKALEPVTMQRPDGMEVEAKWIAMCADCMEFHEKTDQLPDVGDDFVLDGEPSFQQPS